MEQLSFYKYSGHGNDFVIIDNWEGHVPESELSRKARLLSRLKFGIGADGVVYIAAGPDDVDFAVRFFNADGSEADMCGNASRCAAHLAYTLSIAGPEMTFQTNAGSIHAEVADSQVRVSLPVTGRGEGLAMVEVDGYNQTYHRINTGVAHAVAWVDDVEAINVVKIGRAVRRHVSFHPGTNVDFVQVVSPDTLVVRTYEKGVEDETLACGTGCTASALLSARNGYVRGNRVVCKTRGGEDLIVRWDGDAASPSAVYLEGQVRYIFSGQTGPDVLKVTRRSQGAGGA
ncbi:MAG: diaminopimelate epimerase [Deltaproteobacteria bacterium]|jgi:diaminopimelate epimerase|nr:diaminopimelate epimerase [Deltaproteobacteria bacterium]